MTTTLESGIEVAHYDVIGPIGAGGMGEVYKARDTMLDRTVALKILPPALVRNDERVRRFIQEAKSASALNHPNIITIYEIGHAVIGTPETAAGDHPIWYIAMELIDGSTLKQKIYEERADLRSLLAWLAQCAEGLAKAHAVGLIHRDLKPENIMITRDGFAKVLDFGLAKLTIRKSDASTDSTIARDDTREGALLGTVAYMSPEQVQGRVVDHRSDVFSFGSILYEVATRRRPFEADSDVEVMHQILHDKPPAIDEIDPRVPAELRRMIRRCMAKDPERRYQSMRDVALELGEIVDEFDELSAAASSRSSGSLSQPIEIAPVSHRHVWTIASIAGAVAIAALAFGIWQWRLARAEKANVAYGSMRMDRVTDTGNVRSFAISPDGRYLTHVVRDENGMSIAVRQIATGSDVRIVQPQNAVLGVAGFSRDGNYVYYVQSEQANGVGYMSLYQVPALGGVARKILFDVDTSISFSPDGKQFAFGRGSMSSGAGSLVVANADGTGVRTLLTIRTFGATIAHAWSPDGTKIVTISPIAGSRNRSLVAIDPATMKQEPAGSTVWESTTGVQWLPDGSGLVVAGRKPGETRDQIWFQPFPKGEAVRITNDLNDYRGVSISADGKNLATVQIEYRGELFVSAPDDPTGGHAVREAIGNWRVLSASVSRSGAIAYAFGSDKGVDIAVLDAPGQEPRVLTNDGKSDGPSISYDGTIITYTSRRESTPHVWLMSSDGSSARQLTSGEGEVSSICRDGKTVYYRRSPAVLGGPVMRIPVSGGAATMVVPSAVKLAVSPDGTRIMFASFVPVEGRDVLRVTVARADGTIIRTWQPIPWTNGTWTPDGNEIACVKTDEGISNVFLQPLTDGPARQLTHFRKGVISSIDWMPDGKLLILRSHSRSDAVLIRDFR